MLPLRSVAIAQIFSVQDRSLCPTVAKVSAIWCTRSSSAGTSGPTDATSADDTSGHIAQDLTRLTLRAAGSDDSALPCRRIEVPDAVRPRGPTEDRGRVDHT